MGAKKVTTSFTVSFSAGSAEGILKAEVDDRDVADGGLNSKTSFAPGDPVVYLIYKGDGVTVDTQVHSYGSHTSLGGQVVVKKEESLTFYGPDTLEQSLNYPVAGISGWEWVGTSTFDTPKFNGEKVSVVLPSGVTYAVGVLKVTYTSLADPYKLVHAPLGYDSYEIATLVVGTYTPPKV